MSPPIWIIVDLDGTLADCSHRIDFARAKDWEEFHRRCHLDKCFPDVSWFLKSMNCNPYLGILMITGRTEPYRAVTERWLQDMDIFIDELLMRPENDYTPDVELKIRMAEEFFGSKGDVLGNVKFVLEDRDRVVEAWRNYGLPCWQVRAGEY